VKPTTISKISRPPVRNAWPIVKGAAGVCERSGTRALRMCAQAGSRGEDKGGKKPRTDFHQASRGRMCRALNCHRYSPHSEQDVQVVAPAARPILHPYPRPFANSSATSIITTNINQVMIELPFPCCSRLDNLLACGPIVTMESIPPIEVRVAFLEFAPTAEKHTCSS
jgi:hypothetical protein